MRPPKLDLAERYAANVGALDRPFAHTCFSEALLQPFGSAKVGVVKVENAWRSRADARTALDCNLLNTRRADAGRAKQLLHSARWLPLRILVNLDVNDARLAF